MDYTDFCADKQVRDDAPLDFCDWSENNSYHNAAALVDYFDSVNELTPAVIDELTFAVDKITADKKRALNLQLWVAMDIYAKKKIPELQKEIAELAVLESTEKIEKRKMWLTKKIKSLNTLASRCASCGNSFKFGVYENKCSKEQIKKLLSAKTCKNRLCPQCNARKAFKASMLALAQIVSMSKNNFAIFGKKGKKKKIEFLKGVDTSFLTLTVENPKIFDVKECFKKMRAALSILFSNNTNSKKSALRNDWIRKHILGALACLEWFGDKTKNGEAHLHFHILLIHDGALPNSKKYVETIFRRAWATALGREGEWLAVEWHAKKSYEDSLKEVKEKGVYVEIEKFANVPDPKNKALFAMVLETAKYAVTQANLEKQSPENIAELYNQTEYCRQIEKFGVLQGFEFPDGETKESILESIFADYENLEDENLWALRAFIKIYWSYLQNKYKAEFVDDFEKILNEAPELEKETPPLDFACSNSADVPLG